jgi:hypothetical protein
MERILYMTFHSRVRLFAYLILLSCVAVAIGCGSASSSGTSTITNANAQSTTFNIGDAPLNGVLAFEVTINNITLTGSKGTVSVLTTPEKIELSHLAGTFIPFRLTKIPADSYSQISVTFGAAEVLFIPSGSTTPVHVDIPALAAPVNVALNPAVVVPQGASTLNLDVKLANSLAIDAANNVTFTPVFTLVNAPVGAAGHQEDEDGELEDIKGMLSAVSGTQFTVTLGTGTTPMTFNTDSTTVFDPQGTVLSSVPIGTVLEIDGVTQADGTFLAKKVEIETENHVGLETEGLVSQLTGTPPTSFQLVAHEVTGPVSVVPNLGSSLTVNVGSNTSFRVAGDNVNLSGLSFQFKSAADLAVGQNVEADSDAGNSLSFTASRVQLKPQALDGTVAAISGNQFQLTLDPNSVLAKLSGASTVNVFTANAENKTGVTLANGQKVRVRGLLFFTATPGATPSSYNLVARRVQNQ